MEEIIAKIASEVGISPDQVTQVISMVKEHGLEMFTGGEGGLLEKGKELLGGLLGGGHAQS